MNTNGNNDGVNGAKLREALSDTTSLLESILDAFSKGTGGVYKSDVAEALDKARAALATPATTEKPSAVDDGAKLRDALKEIRARLVYLYGRMDGTFDPPALKEVCEIADEALAKPPRNCDVGTVIDQRKRYAEMCQYNCDRCALQDSRALKGGCALAWAQMPYDEAKGGAK